MTKTTARAALPSSHRTLRVGTRGSPLARAQAARIARDCSSGAARFCLFLLIVLTGIPGYGEGLECHTTPVRLSP